jgi:hypothetical protein
LRSPSLNSKLEPGLDRSSALIRETDDSGVTVGHRLTLGMTDPLTVGREPSALEAVWYGRLLVRVFVRPGLHSRRILITLAGYVLSRFVLKRDPSQKRELVIGAIDAFMNRKHPGRNFMPPGETLDAVIDEVRGYVATALINNAAEWLHAEASRGQSAIEDSHVDPAQHEDALNAYIDRKSQGDEDDDEGQEFSGYVSNQFDESALPMPAPSTGRKLKNNGLTAKSVPTREELIARAATRRPVAPASMSRSQLAREIGCPRTTLLNALERWKKERGTSLEGADGRIVIGEKQIQELRKFVGGPRKPYARKRRAPRVKYPKGARLFGGDLAPAAKGKG